MPRRSKAARDPITVLVSESTRLGCQLLADALQRSDQHFSVTASAVTSKEVLKAIAEQRPHVALISANLEDGPLTGLAVLRRLHSSSPQTRPILLTESSAPEMVVSAFRAGANGIFCRTGSFEALCKCISAVHKGQIWVNNTELQFVLEVLSRAAPPQRPEELAGGQLTRREEEIVDLVAQGLTNREISEQLNLSTHTVKNYLFRIFDKLGVSSRVELVLYAVQRRQSQASPSADPSPQP